jgi:hypothetical protein
MRTGAQRGMRGFKRGNGLLARNRREGIEEFVEAVTSLKVIYQVAQWYPGANEDRRSTQNLGVAMDDRKLVHHLITPRAASATLSAVMPKCG